VNVSRSPPWETEHAWVPLPVAGGQSKPNEIRRVSGIRPILPSDAKIWSWFEHRDTITGEVKYEYIEPLVSHLRHPLARCGPYGEIFLLDRSYVLPGVLGTQKSYLFDAGASSWNDDMYVSSSSSDMYPPPPQTYIFLTLQPRHGMTTFGPTGDRL
jgi:hypothetical protein